jgi:isopenicillin-N N-acyltransferase-like protein
MKTAPFIVALDSADPFERGIQRGRTLRDGLAMSSRVYRALFATVGIERADVQRYAEESIAATEAWSSALAEEMRGTAEGSGLPLWEIASLNARTEILSRARGTKPGECSTIVSTRGTPVASQTWDWHEELSAGWHVQQVSGGLHSFVGLTEHGILSKIGMNDAGIGVMLNILGHQDDTPGGVPVHLVGARVLAEASTFDEALNLLLNAPVSTSSAVTLLGPDGAATIELNPHGAAVVRPQNGVLLHTNHFLDPTLAQGEKPGLYDPDSQLRMTMLEDRTRDWVQIPSEALELVPLLVSRPGDLADLCCIPEAGAPLGERWATLATISLDVARRSMTVSSGSPADVFDAQTHSSGAVERIHLVAGK